MRVHSNGNIGIGTTTPTSLFSIKGSGNSAWTAYFNNPQTVASATGVYATVATPSTTVNAYCLYGTISAGGGYNHGVKGSAYNSSMQSTGQAFGVYGQAGGATTGYNFGVVGRLLGSNYGAGVFGCDNNNSEGYVGGSYAGYFVGKVRTTNDSPEKPTSGSWTGYSDIRLKKDTASFKQGMEVIRKIHPITYKFTGAGNLPSQTTNIGVSAQDIEFVAPYCVSSGKLVMTQSESSNFGADVIASLPADSAGISRAIVSVKTFNYDPLIYISINALNQLDSTVTALKKELIDTKTLLQSAIQSGGIKVEKNENSEDRKSSNGSALVAKLWQNNPNPFNQTTAIKCFIPEQNKAAMFLIFDMNGTLKRSIPVNGKGETSVTIYAKEFMAGMYHYSLIIDGQEIDTKKMILTE